MKSTLLILIVAMLAAGCTTPTDSGVVDGPRRQSEPFVAADFEPFMGKGTARITGSAFLKTRGGDVKLGAGCVVELVPMTAYIAERYRLAVEQGVRLEPREPGVEKFVRTTVADARGEFEFADLPEGRWALQCKITWERVDVGPGNTPYAAKSGGAATGIAETVEGQTVRVVVTR